MPFQKWWLVAGLMALLSGCATQAPAPIATAPPNNPSLAQVRAQPNDYKGIKARWGGTIAAVENQEQETVLLIVSRPLNDEGKPQVDATSPGRFMAKINGFLDPAIYTAGRLVTVVGTITGSESRKIGSYSYLYPVVAVEHYYLWPQPAARYRGRYPCYDPFWYGPPFSRFRYGYFGWGSRPYYYGCP